MTDLRVWIEQSLEKENLKIITPSKKKSSKKSTKSRASSSKKSKTHHSRASSTASKNREFDRELNSRDLAGDIDGTPSVQELAPAGNDRLSVSNAVIDR